jgi:hypothetical protein
VNYPSQFHEDWHSPKISTKPFRQTAPKLHKQSFNLQIMDILAAIVLGIQTKEFFGKDKTMSIFQVLTVIEIITFASVVCIYLFSDH